MKLRAAIILCFAFAGCEDPPPPPPPPPPPEEPPPPPPEPAPTSEVLEEASEVAYAYSPIGKRDPFRSIFEEISRSDEEAELTELQKFEVDQLRLSAIVTGPATPYAMVEDPNAKGHSLTRGTLVGKNWGRVAAITPDCVVIREEYRDYTGRKVENKIEVCLPKEGATAEGAPSN